MLIKVKNIHNTSDRLPPTGYFSWKDFWMKKTGLPWPTYCQVHECYKRAEVGAHVVTVYGSREWYIVPLCQEHNHTEIEFYVDSRYLVKIND